MSIKDKIKSRINSLKLHKHHISLIITIFMDSFGVSLVLPLLPIIFKEIGGSFEMWGFFKSVYSIF